MPVFLKDRDQYKLSEAPLLGTPTQPLLGVTPDPPPGVMGVVGRAAAGAAIPTAGAIAGAEALAPVGVAAGAPAGPIGSAIGGAAFGLGGAVLGGMAAAKGQQALFEAAPGVRDFLGQNPEQIAADEEAHPIARVIGEVAPQAVMLNPTNLLARGLSTAERVAAGGGAVIGGAIQGGQEAFNELQQGQDLDPAKIAIQSAAGAAFSGRSRFGLPDIVGGARTGVEAAAAAPEPIPDNHPADLLALTDRRGEQPIAVPQPLALPAPDQVRPLAPEPGAQVTAFSEGLHPDLLARANPDFVAGPTGAIDNTGASDAARVETLQPRSAPFSVGDVFNRIGADVEGGAVKGRDKPFALQVAQTLAERLRADDVDGARAYLAEQSDALEASPLGKAAVDKRAAVLAAAHDVVDDYYTRPGQEAPKPAAAEPVSQEPVAAPEAAAAPEAPAAPRLDLAEANRLGERSIARTSAALSEESRAAEASRLAEEQRVAAHRQGLLDGILDDPDTRNPTGRFISALRKAGYPRELTREEAARIARHEELQQTFAERTAAEPAAAPAEDTTLGVPEAPAPERGLQPRAPQRPFEMTPYSEADLARRDAAEARRQARAERQEPLPEGPENAPLFDANGEPSLDVRRGQAIAAADKALAEVRGKVAREVVQQAHDAMSRGEAEPELVGHVAEMTRQGKVAQAKQLLATITNRPEDGSAPVTRTAEQVVTVREAALRESEGMGSTKTSHFMHGVDAELGLSRKPRPDGPTKQAAYDAGRRFAREWKPAEAAPGDQVAADIQDALDRGEISKGSAKLLQSQLGRLDPAQIRKNLDATVERNQERQGSGLRARLADRAPAARPQTLSGVADDLLSRLDRMGLHDVGLRVADRFEEFGHEGPPASGRYDNVSKLIDVALDSDPIATLNHEAVHAMRDLGLFKPDEWDVLVAAAMKRPDLRAFIEKYEGLTLDERLEEAVAELHATWDAKAGGPVSRLVQKVRSFLEALGNALKGRGFQSAEDVIARIRSGELGARERDWPLAESVVPRAMARQLKVEDAPKSAAAAATDTLDTTRKLSLNFLAVRQFKYHFPQLREPLNAFWEALSMSGAARADRQFRSAQVVSALKKLPAAEREAVSSLGLDATVAQQDPLKPGNPMHERFQALSPQAQAAYRAAREDLQRQWDEFQSVQQAIIESSETLSPQEKKAAVDAMRREGLTVYWPMKRFGDLLAIAKTPEYAAAERRFEEARQAYDAAVARGADEKALTPLRAAMGDAREAMAGVKDGKVVEARERRSELMDVVKALQAEGYEVVTATKEKGGLGQAGNAAEQRAAIKALDQQIADEQARAAKLSGEDKAAVERTIETLEGMKTMLAEVHATFSPEGSALRAGMRRKGVAGFSQDGVRAFALASQQNAGFTTAMEFGAKARSALADLKAAAAKTGDYTQMQVYDQLKKHYDELGRYASTPVADFLSNAAYAYNLGASPSFILMNLLQTPTVTAPVMAARFGPKAVTALTQAGADVVAARTAGHVTPETLGKDAGEVELLRYLERQGVITTSEAASLRDTADPKGLVHQAGSKLMEIVGYIPHHTERFNRISTALADYRLAIQDKNLTGLVSDKEFARAQQEGWKGTREQLAAAMHAREMTLDTHVDYGRANAPYYMQAHGKLGMHKLMFQFQKYQQSIIELEVRSAKQAFDKSMDPKDRAVALRTLIGVLGSQAVMAGAMGLPGFGAVSFLLNAWHKTLGDRDTPWDAETAFRKFVTEHMGMEAGNVIARGILYTPGLNKVVPADVTNRLGMGDLLAPQGRLDEVDRDALAQYIGSAVGGPAGGMVGNFLHGYKLMREGQTERGMEQLLPKALRDLARTARFADEGVVTESGAPVLARDQLTGADLAIQALGFTPQKVETMQANRAAVQAARYERKDRRTALTRRYAQAVAAGDMESVDEAREEIARYNQAQLDRGLTSEILRPSALSQAVKRQALAEAQLDRGVSLRGSQEALLDEGFLD